MRRSIHILIPLALTFAFCGSASADIYKWVDDEGRVHYTDTPPPDKGVKVEVNAPKQMREPDAGELRRLELLRNAEVDRQVRERREAYEQANSQEARHGNAQACNEAKNNWYALWQKMPVYWTADRKVRAFWSGDPYDGERTFIEGAERRQLIGQSERDIAHNCPGDFDQAAMDAGYEDWKRNEWCLVAKAQLERALNPKSRTPKDKVAEIRGDVAEHCPRG